MMEFYQQFNDIIAKVQRVFNVGKEDSEIFKYCGIDLSCIDNTIHFNQEKYSEEVSPVVDSLRAMQKDSQLSENERQSL